jgi:trigger factor
VLAELISHHRTQSVDADALRAAVEEIASTYQDPEEVVNWYYANQEQLSGVESGCSRTGWLSNSSKRPT